MVGIVSELVQNIVGSYSRWPMGTIKFRMVAPSTPNVNDRYELTQDGKTYRFLARLYPETIVRSDAFFADYFTYLDANTGVTVGPQTLAPYYGTSLGNRIPPGSIYGIPVMRVK